MNVQQLAASHPRLCAEALQLLTAAACSDLPAGGADDQCARKLQAVHLITTLELMESLVAAVKSGLADQAPQAVELCLEIINRSAALASYCESLGGRKSGH